jgi:photosystem II stability/assembly factor-like uncharacterized protein
VTKDAFGSFRVFRSGDGGATWQRKTTTSQYPTSLHVHPADSRRVLVGFASLGGNGVLVTNDGGETWKKLFHGYWVDAVAGDPRNPNRVWLGDPEGLWRSDDGGVTRTKVADGRIGAIATDPRRPARVIVGGSQLLVSNDGGTTFAVAEAGRVAMHVSDIVASPRDPDTLYAATVGHWRAGLRKGGRGVLRSTDGGRTWENVSRGLENLSVTSLALSGDGEWLFAGTTHGGVHRLSVRR